MGTRALGLTWRLRPGGVAGIRSRMFPGPGWNWTGRQPGARVIALLLGLVPGMAGAAPWTIDPETAVQVDADWHGSTVVVTFPTVRGSIDFDEKNISRARATIEVATGDATTGVGMVDRVVRGEDFLDAADYPAIVFHLDRLVQTSASTADLTGRVTLRNVTLPATFKATVIRYGPDPDDPAVFDAGFDITGSIDPVKFGSTGGLPDVGAILPVHIRLLMSSR